MHKKLLIGIGLLAALLLAYWLSSPGSHRVRKMPRLTSRDLVGHPEVGPAKAHQCASSFSMKFGESSIEDGHFTVRLGDTIPIHASYMLNLSKMPQGSRGRHNLRAAYRPVNSSDDAWAEFNTMEWHFGGNGKKVNDQIWAYTRSRDATLNPKLVSPGEYEVRVFLNIRDPEGENDMVEYLGRMRMHVLPADEGGNS